MKKEEVLFTTDATITFDEYARYSNYICRFTNALSYILWIGITSLLCFMAVRSGEYRHAVLIAVACIIKVASSPAVRKQKLKEAFSDSDSVGNCYLVYDFYEDGFVMTCNMEEDDLVRYYDIWKIIETKTNFYILVQPRNGCILIKENCSPELIRFLRYLRDAPGGPLYFEDVKATAQMGEEYIFEFVEEKPKPFTLDKVEWQWESAVAEYCKQHKIKESDLNLDELDETVEDTIWEYAGTHIAFFMIWIIQNDFYNPEELDPEEAQLIQEESVNGVDFLLCTLDGRLVRSFMKPEILDFVDYYYEDGSRYTGDYCYFVEHILGETALGMRFSWDVYHQFAPTIDEAYHSFSA